MSGRYVSGREISGRKTSWDRVLLINAKTVVPF